MTVHIIKLCVGIDKLSALGDRQERRIAEMKRAGQAPELIHVTRQMPKRAAEVLDGGSIYWVIKGWIAARQELLELRPVKKDGVPHCAFVYGKKLIPVSPRPRRAFQGWRYLNAADAPPDMAAGDDSHAMPDSLRRELIELGLL